ncbi:MAG: phosphoadenylyl-sulfate reductase [Bacteroidales bacterium]|nr:phosphoadenylyl-sulfate reductase [Bacteroidales bacterium]
MKETLVVYNKKFEKMQAEEMLASILQEYGDKVAFSSSMSAEDQVVTHMLCALTDTPVIFTLDTGRLFYETYDLIDKTNKHFGISIRVMFPDNTSIETMVKGKGINLFYDSIENRKLCCRIRKIEPLERALQGNKVWITGLRSEQSPTRHDLRIAEYDDAIGIIKLNPLLHWKESEVWEYIRHHQIPYNPLHDQGFPSLGCKPCTRAILPGEDIRAGRWWWEHPESRECGLHRSDKKG